MSEDIQRPGGVGARLGAGGTLSVGPHNLAGPTQNEKILFWASFLTLIAAGIGFSVRGAILGDWSRQFGFTQGELGTITGGGLVGFGITIIFFSFLADSWGYGPLMGFAFFFHFSSAIVTLAATYVFDAYGKDATYWCLFVGMFLFSLGNGTCEAVINPLTASLYPKSKTHWLNILHAGWPGGLILGALLGLLFESLGVRWEIQMGTFLVPTILYGGLMLGRKFPHTEAKAAGIPMRDMLKEIGLLGAAVVCALIGLFLADILPGFHLPSFLGWVAAAGLLVLFGSFSEFRLGHWMLAFLFVLHGLVGYVELGTDSWITNITGTIMANKQYGLMLFIWTSGLMFVLRFFAGPIVHHISPLGLLFISAVLGCTGLLLLGSSMNTTIGFCILAATVYGFGKTFLWPTMLGVVSERFPRGGALTLGVVGGVGMLSAGLLGGPGIGYKQDYFASSYLQEHNKAAFERYAARNEDGTLDKKSFLVFPAVTGLDGSKVAVLLGEPAKVDGKEVPGTRQTMENDKAALAKADRKLADDKNLEKLVTWWDTTKEYEAKDKVSVGESRLYGGKMALTYTAAVPAAMALGYLFLILCFKLSGGYTAQVLTGHAAKDEKFTGGTEGPGEA
jgi:MFS family permease